MNTAFASPKEDGTADMENPKPQLSSITPPPGNSPIASTPTPHSYCRHLLIARKLSDVLFSALATKCATNGTDHSLSFRSDQLKSDIECHFHEHFPFFHTPTHLPYASMIQRAIAEVGEEDGLNEESISDFIVNEYEDLPWAHAAFLRRHLGKLCESGELVKSECGRYNFKVEGEEVERKKRQRKSAGRSRRQKLESEDEIEEDFDRKKRSKKLVIKGSSAEEVVTSKGAEELNGSSIGVEDGDHAQGGQVVLDELEGIQEDEMIDEHHAEEIKYKDGPKDFDQQKQSGKLLIISLHAPVTIKGIGKQRSSLEEEVHEVEEGDHGKGGKVQVLGELKEVRKFGINDHHEVEVKSRDGFGDFCGRKQLQDLVVVGLHANQALTTKGTEYQCSSLREKSDGAEGDRAQVGQTEVLDKFKEVPEAGMFNVHHEEERQGEVMREPTEVSDDQTGISKGREAEYPRLSKEQSQVRWRFEITGTSSTSMAAPLPQYQTEKRLKHAKQGTPGTFSTSEVDKNENTNALLPSDIICSPNIQPRGHRGRGRPRKLKVQETLATSFSSSAQDCDQQHWESKAEDRETSGPHTGNGTHQVDQQRLKLLRGRGRVRGRAQVVRPDQISVSETFSPSMHLHHQQSPEKRRCGRPPKRKFDEDTVSKDISTSLENEQQEQEGCGVIVEDFPEEARKKRNPLIISNHNMFKYINKYAGNI